MGTCDVCGQLAMVKVADLEEQEPRESPDGSLHERWQPVAFHQYCNGHRKPGAKFYRQVEALT